MLFLVPIESGEKHLTEHSQNGKWLPFSKLTNWISKMFNSIIIYTVYAQNADQQEEMLQELERAARKVGSETTFAKANNHTDVYRV